MSDGVSTPASHPKCNPLQPANMALDTVLVDSSSCGGGGGPLHKPDMKAQLRRTQRSGISHPDRRAAPPLPMEEPAEFAAERQWCARLRRVVVRPFVSLSSALVIMFT